MEQFLEKYGKLRYSDRVITEKDVQNLAEKMKIDEGRAIEILSKCLDNPDDIRSRFPLAIIGLHIGTSGPGTRFDGYRDTVSQTSDHSLVPPISPRRMNRMNRETTRRSPARTRSPSPTRRVKK